MLFVILIMVSLVALIFSTQNLTGRIKDAGLTLFSGLRSGIYEATSFVSRTVLSIKELSILRREYNELTERISRYEQLERSAAEIRQENNRLREQLGFAQTLRYRHIPAEVIGRDPDNLFSAIIINKGSFSGIAVNMPVIAYQNGTQSLVGKVIQAGAFESLVMPLYNNSSFIASRLSQSRYEGIIEGRGSAETFLLMRYIRKQARDEISIGDMVVSSGMGGIYPSGINIGRVSRILYQENEISMELEVEASIDFSRLEYVFVIETISDLDAGDGDD
ncbi:MAG: rod shape-determining protein MreC [Treponema sp.]|nr:rod shape-determining protein MreC [Treponema sp.]